MSEDVATNRTAAEGLVIERVFDAPRELLFRAWTEPEHFARWYGPEGFTTPHCSMDVKVGGKLHFCMRHEQMRDMWHAGVYQVIDPPGRLAFSVFFSDEAGNKVAPSEYGVDASFPDETTVSLIFEELGPGKTRMTMHHSIPSTMAGHAGDGWNQSFDRLAAYLAPGGGVPE